MALDIIIWVVIGVAALLGYRRGMVGQIGQLLALLVGVLAARMFGDNVARFIAGASAPDMIDYVAAYGVVFIAAYLLTWTVARVLRKVIRAVSLGIVDRLCGALFKACLWTLALSLVLNLYLIVKGNSHELDHPRKPWRAMVVRFAPATLGFLSDELKSAG